MPTIRPDWRVKHGMYGTPLYGCWISMLQRTQNPESKKYPDYGGRGIKVCERWMVFEHFLDDMGPTWKQGLSLDRIDNDGNYEPTNCRWATSLEQGRNKRNNVLIEWNGKIQCIGAWCEETGLADGTLRSRLAHGWDVGTALSEPAKRGHRPKGHH